MQRYIAWLGSAVEPHNYCSVAVGTLAEVKRKAREIAANELWRKRHETTSLRITTYGKQLFAECVIL